MKNLPKFFLLFLVALSSLNSNAKKNINTYNQINVSTLENGWYASTVQYTNYSTGTNAKYTLSVNVQNDAVTSIDFGNGGSVHTGYNNEGYIYSGGYLTFEKDYQGNILAANASVTVSDANGIRYYKIKIE